MRFESHKYAIAALAFAGYSFAAAATEGSESKSDFKYERSH